MLTSESISNHVLLLPIWLWIFFNVSVFIIYRKIKKLKWYRPTLLHRFKYSDNNNTPTTEWRSNKHQLQQQQTPLTRTTTTTTTRTITHPDFTDFSSHCINYIRNENNRFNNNQQHKQKKSELKTHYRHSHDTDIVLLTHPPQISKCYHITLWSRTRTPCNT